MQHNCQTFDLLDSFELQNGIVNFDNFLIDQPFFKTNLNHQIPPQNKKNANPSTQCTSQNLNQFDDQIFISRESNDSNQIHDLEELVEEEQMDSQSILEQTNIKKQIQSETIVNTVEESNNIETSNKIQVEKNDSKNVPKGMMKAFAHMILSKNPEIKKVLKNYFQNTGQDLQKYRQFAKKIRKSSKISIGEIRDMLTVDEFMKTTRTLGFYFLRKRFLHHIFYSKMQKQNIHLKYIHRWKAIFQDPINFRSLK